MTHGSPVGEDPALPLPPVPGLDSGLGTLDPRGGALGLPAVGAIGPGIRIGVEGAGLCVGRERTVLEGLRVEGAEAGDTRRSALGAERRLRLDGSEIVERAAAAWTAPVAFFEWQGLPPIRLAWTIRAAPARPLHWRTGDGVAVVDRGLDRIVLALHPPGAISASGAGPGLRMDARPGRVADRTLLAVALVAADGPMERALRVMGRPHVVVPAREAAVRRVLESRLVVRSDPLPLGDALGTAVMTLAANEAAVPRTVISGEEATLVAGALLATGAPAAARTLLTRPSAPAEGSGAARLLVLAGRYLAWTGDIGTVRAAWDTIRDGAIACAALPGSRMRNEALASVARIARDLGMTPPPVAAELEDGPASRPPPPDPGADPHATPTSPVMAARTVDRLVARLGLVPDATRGRLELRPRLGAGLRRLDVRKLRIGDAHVGLRYARTGASRQFTLDQDRGGAPLTVVFEPLLEGSAVAGVRIDGEPAPLQARPIGGRWRLAVQLVLDAPRTVEVEMVAPAD